MKLLITDLDNTLYDWVTYYAKAFKAMVKELSVVLSINEEQLYDEFQMLHQDIGTTDFPHAIFDLPSVKRKFKYVEIDELLNYLNLPLSKFASYRTRYLKLYPNVKDTLEFLRANGVILIAHTEANPEQAYSRLKKLRIAKYFHHIYALQNNDAFIKAGWLFSIPPANLISKVPSSERKPNPALLWDICRKEGVEPEETCYVGDSLVKDVGMAKKAGLTAIWAKYGTNYNPHLWDILVRVTHWTEMDVIREKELKRNFEHIKPDFVIESFSEILNLGLFNSNDKLMNS